MLAKVKHHDYWRTAATKVCFAEVGINRFTIQITVIVKSCYVPNEKTRHEDYELYLCIIKLERKLVKYLVLKTHKAAFSFNEFKESHSFR